MLVSVDSWQPGDMIGEAGSFGVAELGKLVCVAKKNTIVTSSGHIWKNRKSPFVGLICCTCLILNTPVLAYGL